MGDEERRAWILAGCGLCRGEMRTHGPSKDRGGGEGQGKHRNGR